jgi:hypothetical protein
MLFVVGVLFTGSDRGPVASYELAMGGRHAAATITRLAPQDHDGCVFEYALPDGERYSAQEGGCGTDHQVGDVIAVVYVPGHPRIVVVGSGSDPLRNITVAIVLVPALFAGLVGLEARRLRKQEDAAPGLPQT